MTLRPAGERGFIAAGTPVADLVDHVPALPIDTELATIVGRCLDHDQDWLVLVDDGERPVRLVERAAMLRCESFEHPAERVEARHPLEEAARRAVARAPVERLRPLVACDPAGRYVGLLRMDTLLAALAGAR